jgi:hypothetical protein
MIRIYDSRDLFVKSLRVPVKIAKEYFDLEEVVANRHKFYIAYKFLKYKESYEVFMAPFHDYYIYHVDTWAYPEESIDYSSNDCGSGTCNREKMFI